jgi:hypothetical protein
MTSGLLSTLAFCTVQSICICICICMSCLSSCRERKTAAPVRRTVKRSNFQGSKRGHDSSSNSSIRADLRQPQLMSVEMTRSFLVGILVIAWASLSVQSFLIRGGSRRPISATAPPSSSALLVRHVRDKHTARGTGTVFLSMIEGGNHFDYLVIGGGSGGMASARRAATYGVKVGVVERVSQSSQP